MDLLQFSAAVRGGPMHLLAQVIRSGHCWERLEALKLPHPFLIEDLEIYKKKKSIGSLEYG